MVDYTHIGQAITKAREQRRITCAQLAVMTGLNPISLGRIERGLRRPKLTTLYLIAAKLRVPLANLLGEHFLD